MLKVISDVLGPRHYFALLGCVICLTVIAPLIDHYLWARVVVCGLVIFSLLAGSFAAGRGRGAFKSFLFALLSAAMWLMAFTFNIPPFNTSGFGIASYAVTLFFFVTICNTMWQDIFSGVVTLNRICGAVCIYILIGFCFAMVHMMVVLADPAAYKDNSVTNQRFIMSEPMSAEKRYPMFIYFSFCTLSTLGYGDVVPASRLARSLSWVESLTGQLYLAILVARLVGLHIAGSTASLAEPPNYTRPVREFDRSRR